MHGSVGCRTLLNRNGPYLTNNWVVYCIIASVYFVAHGDPGAKYPIEHVKPPYMEWSQHKEAMQRDYRLLQEGMRGHMLNFKAHFLAVLHVNTPGFKRFKFVNYLHNDEDIIPIQYIDWSRERPVLTNRPLDFYVSGGLNLFCLEPQYGVELYTFDGRFYRDPDGLLRSMVHHLPIMGEKGRLYVKTDNPEVDLNGRIFDDELEVGKLKIVSFKSPTGLWTIEGSVFYQREPEKVEIIAGDYQVIQGYHEAQNEPPGMMTAPTIVPFGEGIAKSAKTYIDTYELLFKAVDDN